MSHHQVLLVQWNQNPDSSVPVPKDCCEKCSQEIVCSEARITSTLEWKLTDQLEYTKKWYHLECFPTDPLNRALEAGNIYYHLHNDPDQERIQKKIQRLIDNQLGQQQSVVNSNNKNPQSGIDSERMSSILKQLALDEKKKETTKSAVPESTKPQPKAKSIPSFSALLPPGYDQTKASWLSERIVKNNPFLPDQHLDSIRVGNVYKNMASQTIAELCVSQDNYLAILDNQRCLRILGTQDTKLRNLDLVQCFNCQRYGHKNTRCKHRMRCANCSLAHNGKCLAKPSKCANCTDDGGTSSPVNHRADSPLCPVAIRMEREAWSKSFIGGPGACSKARSRNPSLSRAQSSLRLDL